MGLFDKKPGKKDEFDSPVEEVSLAKNAPKAAEPGKGATSGASAAKPAGAAGAAGPAAAKADVQSPKQPMAPVEPEIDTDFGINKAIELWRKMPKDNVELVVTVIKTTLEAINIRIPAIVKDATRKQGDIERRIEVLKKEIADLESEIASRKKEIDGLEADHLETTEVKERLVLAEKLAEKVAEKGKLAPAKAPEGAAPQGKTGDKA